MSDGAASPPGGVAPDADEESASTPRITATSITISGPDPRRHAEFYARLLGVAVAAVEPAGGGEPEVAGWAQVRTERLTLNFEWERHWQPPVWPAESGRPTATAHLDLHVDDLDAATAWALTCGARLAGVQPQSDVRVLIDPCGHPVCLFR